MITTISFFAGAIIGAGISLLISSVLRSEKEDANDLHERSKNETDI